MNMYHEVVLILKKVGDPCSSAFWTFLTRSYVLSKPLQTSRPTKFLLSLFSFPDIRKLVTQKVKLKLLELHWPLVSQNFSSSPILYAEVMIC